MGRSRHIARSRASARQGTNQFEFGSAENRHGFQTPLATLRSAPRLTRHESGEVLPPML
jgi:hypothetical protein